MFQQCDDGSHEISLHNIHNPSASRFSNTSGILRWSRDSGISYSLTFHGIPGFGPFHNHGQNRVLRGVGRFLETNLSQPTWIAETDDGTEVRLYGVIEVPSTSQTTGTSGFSVSCQVIGTAQFAVVEIPTTRALAFENATEEPYRMLFTGGAGLRHHSTEQVEFTENGTTTTTYRCSIILSDAPRVALGGANCQVKCQPGGWLAFGNAPVATECEVGAFPEQNFVSFLNGTKVGFHWADQKTNPNIIRRTYFGWEKSRKPDGDRVDHQPLPIMAGIEVFEYGEEVRDLLPGFFSEFVQRSQQIDFAIALHPLWTALNSVLQDRLALASVSLERIVSIWDDCRQQILNGSPTSDRSFWKNKPLLKKIRKAVLDRLNSFRGNNHKEGFLQRVTNSLLESLALMIGGESCRTLTDKERKELFDVLTSRINHLTQIPNSARLRRPFEDLEIALTSRDEEAILKRNTALRGRHEGTGMDLESLDLSAEYFDCIRMLITKFVLKVCDYEGPFIDYASRPTTGNFEIQRLKSSVPQSSGLGTGENDKP